MVGVYASFLALDLTAMRRAENITPLSVFPNTACLQQVMRLIAAQFRTLADGFTVLDLANSKPASIVEDKKKGEYFRAEDGKCIPFKQCHCRLACTLGDSVSQIVMAGGRTVHALYLLLSTLSHQQGIGRLPLDHTSKQGRN